MTVNFEIDKLATSYETNWSPDNRSFARQLAQVNEADSDRLLMILVEIDVELAMQEDIPVSPSDYQSYGEAMVSHAKSTLQSIERESVSNENRNSVRNETTERQPAVGVQKSTNYESGGAETSSSRFQVVRLHDRGGLGEVFVAQDQELNREVALKEIQPEYADHSESRNRFILEAEITGGLEHPGIVPVYALGQYKDGRPYYAMRFIKGKSLKDAIQSFHDKTNKVDADRQMELRQLLGRFVDVCQAISYAHSRGILHRDLKPANIMVGQYGETLVVDWGVAKAIGTDIDPQDSMKEKSLQPWSGEITPTVAGSTIGTPAYMPPEQAAGRLHEIGPGSDVYSLGATLYQLLTGQPPFRGDNLPDTLEAVQSGNFRSPRKVNPEVPESLNAICLKAMALRPSDRYQSPNGLATDIERFLADEPVGAYKDPLLRRVRRWIRKHPTLTTTATAVTLVFVIGMLVFSSVMAGVNRKLARLNNELEGRNVELIEANQRKTEAMELAQKNELAARRQSQFTLNTLTRVIQDIQSGLQTVAGSGEIRRKLLNTSLEKLEKVSSEYLLQAALDHQTVIGLIEMGDNLLELGTGSSNLVDSQLTNQSSANTIEVSSGVKLAKEYFDRAHLMAQELSDNNPSVIEGQRVLSMSYSRLGQIQFLLGNISRAVDLYRHGLEIAEQLSELSPKVDLVEHLLFNSLLSYGWIQLESGDLLGAVRSYEKARLIAIDALDDSPEDSTARFRLGRVCGMLSVVSRQLGEAEQAKKWAKASVKQFRLLLNEAPDDTTIRSQLALRYGHLGQALVSTGHKAQAKEAYQAGLDILKDLAGQDPSNSSILESLAHAYGQVGDTKYQWENPTDAITFYQKSLEIHRKLVRNDPTNVDRQRELMVHLGKLGDSLYYAGDSDEALKSYLEVQTIGNAILDKGSDYISLYLDLASSYICSGRILSFRQELETALENYEKGLAILREQREKSPNDAFITGRLPETLREFANLHLAINDPKTAMKIYQECLELEESIHNKEGETALPNNGMARTFQGIGDVELALGNSTEALSSYQKSLHMLLAIDKSISHENKSSNNDHAITLSKMADVYDELGQSDKAVQYYRKSLDIQSMILTSNPDDYVTKLNFSSASLELGNFLGAQDNFSEAIQVAERAEKVLRKMIVENKLKPQAERMLQKIEQVKGQSADFAIALGPLDNLLKQAPERLPSLLAKRGIRYTGKGDYDTAVEAAYLLSKLKNADETNLYNAARMLAIAAFSLKPKQGEPQNDRNSELQKKWIEDSLRILKRAIEAGWSDLDYLESDSAFGILHSLSGYQELFEEHPMPEAGRQEPKKTKSID